MTTTEQIPSTKQLRRALSIREKLDDLRDELTNILGNGNGPASPVRKAVVRFWTPARRRAQGNRMRKYWRERNRK